MFAHQIIGPKEFAALWSCLAEWRVSNLHLSPVFPFAALPTPPPVFLVVIIQVFLVSLFFPFSFLSFGLGVDKKMVKGRALLMYVLFENTHTHTHVCINKSFEL